MAYAYSIRYSSLIFCLVASFMTQSIELNILCWEGYAVRKHIQSFQSLVEKKHNLRVRISVQDVSDPQEFFDGIRSRKADIISPAHNIPKSHRWPMIQSNIVLPIDLKHVPNYQKLIPALKLNRFVGQDGKVYGIPIVYGYYGLVYNKSLVKKPPDSWKVLWDRRNKYQFTVSADYHEANIYAVALSLGYVRNEIFNYDLIMQNKLLRERTNAMAKFAKSLWVGVDKPDDLRGLKYCVVWGFALNAVKEQGEEWAFAAPKEGATGWVDHWLIGYSLANDPIKKMIAEEWINYTLSEEVQLFYHQHLGQQPVVNHLGRSSENIQKTIPTINDDKFVENELILWEILSRREQNGFIGLWNQAIKKRESE